MSKISIRNHTASIRKRNENGVVAEISSFSTDQPVCLMGQHIGLETIRVAGTICYRFDNGNGYVSRIWFRFVNLQQGL